MTSSLLLLLKVGGGAAPHQVMALLAVGVLGGLDGWGWLDNTTLKVDGGAAPHQEWVAWSGWVGCSKNCGGAAPHQGTTLIGVGGLDGSGVG